MDDQPVAGPAQVAPVVAVAAGGRSERTVAESTRPRNVRLDAGTTVGESPRCRWQVLSYLADGGFSSVYEVRPATPETEREYGTGNRALKCLWGTPAELTHIGGEADRMAAVEGHDNVLGLIASFRFDGAEPPYAHYVGLVLELAGEDLYQFGSRISPPEPAWAAVFEQLAAGLEHIHARRTVHGDIKPTNLLRVGPEFKIADFGVSAPLETTRSAGIGLARTIAFWPPESGSQGERDSDGIRHPPVEGWRASQMGDVWALAVSMHRLITGRHITASTKPEQQYELVCAGRYSIDDRLGPGWRRLLTDCLVHDPEQRVVTTAADLRRRLADLALSDDYRPVPWRQGEPRVAALLDGVVESQTLVLYVAQEGGRVQGLFAPRKDVLLDVSRHLHRVVVPALAQQVRDSQRTAVMLAERQERMAEQAGGQEDDDPARTRIIRETEAQRSRQLAVAVAEVTRQRDHAARDRDQALRRNDALAAERDRLAIRYADMSYRLERLEQERTEARPAAYPPGLVAGGPRPAARARRSGIGYVLWGVVAIMLGAVVGTLVASQIIYHDPWSIITKAVDAVSAAPNRH
ncbi:MAG TPA: protein kinase [Mycobacteriales bacterium]|nr:protein kinase [Mycobacteriales bacterium]